VTEPGGRERFFHTVKRGSGIVREEVEREIAREEFAAAWPRTAGRRLAKTRHRVRDAGSGRELVWEIDVFHGLPLAMVEVELPDERAPCPFPAWLAPVIAREVSLDARYRNAALAMYGVP
jgi:CYTH domain-containing protein